MKIKVTATEHAYDRAKERLEWDKHTVDKMIHRIYHHGRSPGNTKGEWSKFVKRKRWLHPHARNIRIYGENIFFFNGRELITLYRLPNDLINLPKFRQ